MGEEIPTLQVQMLGDFSVTYHGQTLPLKNSLATKAMGVLQLLLYRGERAWPGRPWWMLCSVMTPAPIR